VKELHIRSEGNINQILKHMHAAVERMSLAEAVA